MELEEENPAKVYTAGYTHIGVKFGLESSFTPVSPVTLYIAVCVKIDISL